MSDKTPTFIGEFSTFPSSDFPPEGEFVLEDYTFQIHNAKSRPSTTSYISFKLSNNLIDLSKKEFLPGDEKTRKIIASFTPLMDAFAVGFSSTLYVDDPLVREEGKGGSLIRKGSNIFGREYKKLLHSLTEKMNDLYKSSENDEKTQRFFRSLRKYRTALNNRKHSIEFFENMWIALESLFLTPKIKTITEPTNPWFQFRDSINFVANQAIENIAGTLTLDSPQKVLSQMKNKYLDAVDKAFLPIKDRIVDQYTALVKEYSKRHENLHLDVEKTVSFYLKNLNKWYEIRNDLFHKADTSTASWREFTDYGYEIKKAVEAYYFMFLHVKDCFFGITGSFPTKEQINEFWMMTLLKEKKEQKHKSIEEIPRRFRIHSILAETIEMFILYFLNIAKEASMEEIIASSYPFGVDISDYQTYITELEFLVKENILQEKEGKFIKNFDKLEDFF